MKKRIILLPLAYVTFCTHLSARSIPADSVPPTLIIVNAFDAAAMKARDKKKELFRELADSLKVYLQREAERPDEVKVITVPDVIKVIGNYDSLVSSLIKQYNASGIIIIKDLDVFFNQTNVEVTKDEYGKSRVASYDICTAITYDGYWIAPGIKSSAVNDCSFFTKRNVVSGFFAAGPDIVGKSKYAFKPVYQNARSYMLNYFPWK